MSARARAPEHIGSERRIVKERLVLSALSACVVATFLYAALRIVQFSFFPEPNPATILWSAHAGYFWRALTASYAAGAVGFVAFLLTRTHAERLARILVSGVRLAAWTIFLQALLFP
jgi:hypothetical protein